MFKFIDLFAGLGGFHKALDHLGCECVFASELNAPLRNIYKDNFGIDCQGDIKKIVKEDIQSIPEHDILCAGFPCQPFSKAGNQKGRKDVKHGNLFDEILKILDYRRPTFFILENVQFIRQHDNEATWQYMESELRKIGYDVRHEVFSPHDFGIPQHRQRIFIVGRLGENSLQYFKWMKKHPLKSYNVKDFIEEDPTNVKFLENAEIRCLELWQEFIDAIPAEVKVPGFPIWSMEFGATYPYEELFPHILNSEELGSYKGNFGKDLTGLTKEEQLASLPSYARVEEPFPNWKRKYIRFNREFYAKYKTQLEKVVRKIAEYEFQSWQKLEWNVGENERTIKNYILQFRASGIRVKKTDFFPSLVCTKTQVPIVGWQNRYITRQEGARLQSLDGLKLPANETTCFKALGNAVNAGIIRMIAERLIFEEESSNIPNNIQYEINYSDREDNLTERNDQYPSRSGCLINTQAY